MHILTRHIVYARNNKEALEKAEENMENMTGERGQVFDWYDMDNSRYEESGSVYLATDAKGKEVIERAYTETHEELKRHFLEIKKSIETKTIEEIMQDSMIRYHFEAFGAIAGGDIFLYDNYGDGIVSKGHLETALTIDKENEEEKDLLVYVVSIDAHF